MADDPEARYQRALELTAPGDALLDQGVAWMLRWARDSEAPGAGPDTPSVGSSEVSALDVEDRSATAVDPPKEWPTAGEAVTSAERRGGDFDQIESMVPNESPRRGESGTTRQADEERSVESRDSVGLPGAWSASDAQGLGAVREEIQCADTGTSLEVPALRERAVGVVSSRLEISNPEAVDALGRSYEVTRDYTAPFVTKVAVDMLGDLKAKTATNPEHRTVFVGRDGHSLAVAAQALEPEFFDRHCSEVVMSRALVEGAVQDVEVNAERSFPQLADFRGAAGKVDSDSVDGARMRLSAYLQDEGVPVGQPGSEVTLIDTSYKGTVQELLAAVYPQTSFQGQYVFFGASPEDPHPETKIGYALHLDADRSEGGRPLPYLSGDPTLTLAHQDAIGAIEETLHGPMSSPTRLEGDGPRQHPQSLGDDPLEGLNPLRVPEPFKDAAVREGAMDINLLAVRDYANEIVTMRTRGQDWQTKLNDGFERFRTAVHSWVSDSGGDPGFVEVMDALVRRADKKEVARLADVVVQADLTAEDRAALWGGYGQLSTIDEKRDYVTQVQRDYGQTG